MRIRCLIATALLFACRASANIPAVAFVYPSGDLAVQLEGQGTLYDSGGVLKYPSTPGIAQDELFDTFVVGLDTSGVAG